MLLRVGRDERVLIGGSFLCRDADGEVRNAFLLAGPDGLLGRHDKDLPTMWENALYVGGDDDGVIEAGDLTVGAALCWEFMRSGTALRSCDGRLQLVERPAVAAGRLHPTGRGGECRRRRARPWL